MKNDLVIDTLTIGRDYFLKDPEGITKDEMRIELTKLGYDLESKANERVFSYVMASNFFVSKQNNNSNLSKQYLGLDSYFSLLDYEELKEARESAKQANKHANWALYLTVGFSIASIIVTVICTYWQIHASK